MVSVWSIIEEWMATIKDQRMNGSSPCSIQRGEMDHQELVMESTRQDRAIHLQSVSIGDAKTYRESDIGQARRVVDQHVF